MLTFWGMCVQLKILLIIESQAMHPRINKNF